MPIVGNGWGMRSVLLDSSYFRGYLGVQFSKVVYSIVQRRECNLHVCEVCVGCVVTGLLSPLSF
jgi:hypothetical protein